MSKKVTNSNNKKAVRTSLERTAAIVKAFKRDHIIELQANHPGQISIEAMLFPVFDYEVES